MKLFVKIEENKLIGFCEFQDSDIIKSLIGSGYTEIADGECEQAYDGNYYIKGFAPQQSIEEYNEQQRLLRASSYASQLDPLTARKARKEVIGEWTEQDESEYVLKMAELSQKIKEENPYKE